MPRFFALAALGVVLTLTPASAFAASCAVVTTVNKKASQVVKNKSFKADTSAKNVAGGRYAGAPETVGAMNNIGAETQPGPDEQQPPEGKVVHGQNSNDCRASDCIESSGPLTPSNPRGFEERLSIAPSVGLMCRIPYPRRS